MAVENINDALKIVAKEFDLDLSKPLDPISIEMFTQYGLFPNKQQLKHYARYGDKSAISRQMGHTGLEKYKAHLGRRKAEIAGYERRKAAGLTMSAYRNKDYQENLQLVKKEQDRIDALNLLNKHKSGIAAATKGGQYSLNDLAKLELESPGFLEKVGSGVHPEKIDRQALGSWEYKTGDTSESGYQVTQSMNEVTDRQYERAKAELQRDPNGFTSQRNKNLIANWELQRGMTGATPTGGEPGGAATAAGTPQQLAAGDAKTQSALQQLESDPQFQGLPDDLKSLYRQVVGEWDVGAEINMEGVLNKFNEIQKNTIDPYFSEQVIKPFVTDLTNQYANLQSERGRELETERTAIGENVRQAKANLEKSGMTFTGKAIEDLGAQAAIGQPGAEGSAIPSQDPFATEGGSQYFYEGKVNQANRLMSTGSAERYQRQLQQLGRQAETQLGSEMAGQLGIPYQQVGGQTGAIEQQKQQQLASTLSSLAGQNRQNVAQDAPLQYNF